MLVREDRSKGDEALGILKKRWIKPEELPAEEDIKRLKRKVKNEED